MPPFDKLAKPAQRALANAGIKSLEDLSKLTESEFMKLHGIGKNSLQALRVALAENSLSFASRGIA
jgi:DNA-directed RNA polymerase alpha subunit